MKSHATEDRRWEEKRKEEVVNVLHNSMNYSSKSYYFYCHWVETPYFQKVNLYQNALCLFSM